MAVEYLAMTLNPNPGIGKLNTNVFLDDMYVEPAYDNGINPGMSRQWTLPIYKFIICYWRFSETQLINMPTIQHSYQVPTFKASPSQVQHAVILSQ